MTRAQRAGLQALTVIALLMLPPSAYMAWSAAAMIGEPGSPLVRAYGALWLLMPALCVVGPILGWRTAREGRTGWALALASLPLAGAASILTLVVGHALTA